MSLELINRTIILDDTLNDFIIEKIGDAKNNVFIDGNCLESIYELMPDVTEKLGLVYLHNENLSFIDKNVQISSLVPSLKYMIHNQYRLIVDNKYNLILITYSQVL